MMFSAKSQRRALSSDLEKAASALVLAWAFFGSGSVQAETRTSITTSVGGELASNPYLVGGPGTSAVSGIVTVSPGVKFLDSSRTIGLNATYKHTEFSRRYRSSDDITANASISQKLSPRLDYSADLGFNSGIVGANDLLTFGSNPSNGGAFPPLPGDIAIAGLRERRQSFSGGMSLGYIASARDNFRAQGGYSIVRFPSGSVASEYDNTNGSFTYNRILSSRMSVGLNVGISRSDYRRTSLGDATTFSPQLTIAAKFGATWSGSAAIGISHSSITGPFGKYSENSLSGSFDLCNAGAATKFCITASRSVQPTSFGGTVRPQTSVGATYSIRLDSKSSIDAMANYSRSGRDSQAVIPSSGSFDYGRASLNYNRRLSQRLRGYLAATFADSYRDPIPRKANTTIGFGLSYAFGDMR